MLLESLCDFFDSNCDIEEQCAFGWDVPEPRSKSIVHGIGDRDALNIGELICVQKNLG
jgi:hypothetical protein